MSVGIYKITNLINNKIYIGQSINIENRWEKHKFYSDKENTLLQKAFKKYGISNFSFEIIEECKANELDEKEIYWIQYYNSFEDGYNMTKGGRQGQTINYQQVLSIFNTNRNITKTAKILHISPSTVRNILSFYNIEYNKNISFPQMIIMIDPYTLKEEKTFLSIKDAAEYLKISDSMIRKYLKGNSKTAGGYYWRLFDEEKTFQPLEKNDKIQNTKKLIILQYDLNHNFIREYNSLSQANLACGKSRSNLSIKKGCEEHIPIYGYYWEYK